MSINTSLTRTSGVVLLEELMSEKRKLISEKTLMDKKDKHVYPIEDIPFNIPEDWVWCYLSDISIIQEGPGIRKHQYCDEGIQFLTVTNILEGEVDLEKSKKYISLDEYQKVYKHFTINYGDIVTACSGGSWGKSAMYELNEKLILNTSTLRLRFFNDLGNNHYLYYLTKTSFFKDSLASHLTGQQPNYGYSHYSKIQLPLPPLHEQQRIVTILDEVFEAIAKAKANAEQNLKNSKELFESYMQGVFETKGEGWEEKKLGDVCSIGDGNYSSKYPKASEFQKEGIPFLTPSNIKNGTVVSTALRYISSEQHSTLTKGHVMKDDLVVVVRGFTTGNNSLLPHKYSNSNLNSQLAYLRVKNVDLLPEFLFRVFNSPIVKKVIQETISGANQRQLPNNKLLDLQISYPSIKEQQIIIKKIDVLSLETKKLEAIYQQKINDLEELKKSVLQKAFSGELKTEMALINV